MLKEVIEDTSALGGIAVFLAAMILAFFTGNKILSLKLFVALILCYVVVMGIRIFYFKQRPDRQEYKTFLGRLDASSFPSLHSARISALAATLFFFFQSIAIKTALAVAIPIVAYTRIWLKRHYLIDAVVGVVIGVIIGLAIQILF